MVRVVCIADLQGQASDISPNLIPDGDILLVAGDLGGWGNIEELVDFNYWIEKLPHKHKLVVAGNHDVCLKDLSVKEQKAIFTNCTLLVDEGIQVEGLNIYGTPLNDMNSLLTRFDAFSAPLYLSKAIQDIPNELDILITHGPAYGMLDRTTRGQAVGSKELRQAVIEKKPRYHVFGHIHEAHGIADIFDTTFINAALCSERNQMFIENGLYFQPIVIEL